MRAPVEISAGGNPNIPPVGRPFLAPYLMAAVGRIAALSDFCWNWNFRTTAGVSTNPPTLLHRAEAATKAPTEKLLLPLIVDLLGERSLLTFKSRGVRCLLTFTALRP